MTSPPVSATNRRTELIIGNLLRAGVVLSASLVLLGGTLYLARRGAEVHDYKIFQGEPADLRTLSGILKGALSLNARGIMQLGLLLLIATPVARVAFSVFAFALERDVMYVAITLIVLGVLIFSLSGGRL